MNFLIMLLMFSKTNIAVSSTAFTDNGNIPQVYSCEGKSINPPLAIGQVPTSAKSLVLIVEDPDADKKIVTHWVLYNIDPSVKSIAENSAPGTNGKNEKGDLKYMGPCPPDGDHHYYFKIYALDTRLTFKKDPTKIEVEEAMENHILAEGQIVGVYQKQKQK